MADTMLRNGTLWRRKRDGVVVKIWAMTPTGVGWARAYDHRGMCSRSHFLKNYEPVGEAE